MSAKQKFGLRDPVFAGQRDARSILLDSMATQLLRHTFAGMNGLNLSPIL
jgi:hypothetical protein